MKNHSIKIYRFTCVVAVALLLPVLGSSWLALELALLVIVPTVNGLIVILTVAIAPLLNVPMAQVTVALPLHFPWLV